jgi:hypothetical protein
MVSKLIYAEHLIQILSILYESMALETDKGIKQKTVNERVRQGSPVAHLGSILM